MEKANSIVLKALIQPSEIEKFSPTDYRFIDSDVLEKKYGVSIGFNDHETRESLQLAVESIYLRESVKDMHESKRNYFEFDDNTLRIHILNPTPGRVHEAVKSYVPVNDYFVNKFPVFMEAAQLIEQGLQLQDFIDRSFGRTMESYVFFKDRYSKVSKRNITQI